MATAKSVSVSLRNGVTGSATLPDNRRMVAGKAYAISLDDYRKLSRSVRETIVSSAINTSDFIVPLSNGTDYALDLADAAMHNVAAVPTGFSLGQVVQGFNGTAFKLVLLSTDGTLGNVNATTTKNVCVWLDESANTVSVKTTAAGNADATFAGVAIGALTAGNYGWIQTEGIVAAMAANADVAAGDTVAVNTGVDGQVRSASEGELKSIALTGFGTTGDQFKLTLDGVETANFLTFDADAGSDLELDTAAVEAFFLELGYTVTAAAIGGDIKANGFTVQFPASDGDVGTVTVTSTTGCSGVETESIKGTYQAAAIGNAHTNSSATKAEVDIRSSHFANRHVKTPKVFIDKN